jgi:hypothetical protein
VPTINQLSSVDTLSAGDQFPVFSSSNGDARKASGSALLAFVEANFASPDYTTVMVAPTVSGFVQPIGATSDNVWLIINAATDFAAGTVQLPPASSAIDGQQVLVVTQNAIASVSVTSAGASVVGFPVALGDSGFFAMRYSADMLTWYCVAQVLSSISTLATITLTSDVGTIKDVNGQTSLQLSKNYAGVTAGNFVQISNRATGGSPQIQAQGVDANVGLSVSTKGSGQLALGTTSGSTSITGSSTFIDSSTTTSVVATTSVTVESAALTLRSSGSSVSIDDTNVGTIFGRVVQTSQCTLAQANTAVGLLAVGRRVGARATITDATAAFTSANVAANITGGGANTVPAYYDGTNWKIG